MAILLDALTLAGSVPGIDIWRALPMDPLSLASSAVSVDAIGGPVWIPVNAITTSGSSPDIQTAHGFLPVPSYSIIANELGSLEITIGGTVYHPETYNRESHLFQPGATWQATVESCDKALWSSVVIREDGAIVLTGYLLKREYERGRCYLSGMDTFVKVESTWITEEVETEIGQTVAYWIDTIMAHTDLEYVYPPSVNDQYVEPHVSLGPMSLHDALEQAIRYSGLYIWVGKDGKINFAYLVDAVRGTVPAYLEREKREKDEITRHQVSVFGMGSIKAIEVGDSLGDPVSRIAAIDSPFISSVADAETTAVNALAAWNKHGDVRTVELAGAYPEHQLADYVTENG